MVFGDGFLMSGTEKHSARLYYTFENKFINEQCTRTHARTHAMSYHKSIARILWWLVRIGELISLAVWIGFLIWSTISFDDRIISLVVAGFHVLAPLTVIAFVDIILKPGEPIIDRVTSALWYWPITAVLVTDTFSFIHALKLLILVRNGFNWATMFFWAWLLLLTLIYEISAAFIHWMSPTLSEYKRLKAEKRRS